MMSALQQVMELLREEQIFRLPRKLLNSPAIDKGVFLYEGWKTQLIMSEAALA